MAVDLSVTDNPLSIPEQVLFEMAARVNKKRGFLFVSKVLGKHIPVHPLKRF
ncbi:phosphoribosyltransferase domain-containing protein [Bacillus rugosus]|uniref:phosphoribosyltransferase domain-containing protein n=1 Tax=Bacillus rugosus TaxID=2715209 RepID=UPI002DBF071C|nr:phosphoribosyltransferase domain-containing protein [Bacillus rugosus]MEC1550449.1 phosphoribosyltransferase domain-containing protein [Bacillus rugosus]